MRADDWYLLFPCSTEFVYGYTFTYTRIANLFKHVTSKEEELMTTHDDTCYGSEKLVPSPFLHGERVYIRRPVMSDAEHVFHWERDDEVWRYDIHRPYSHTMSEFSPLFERNYVKGNGRQFWFIIENEEHVPMGTITYFNLDPLLGQVELGLGIGEKSQWGKGYGTDAIRTVVKYLFSIIYIRRVYAETALANMPSRHAFKKAGFIEVGEIYDPRSAGDPWMLLEIWKPQPEYAPTK